ncbi:serine/arginine repetitive matrix protein 1-like [Bombyx mandarina]|uniref:Serine/arginine repetitive matrix protein 1-like n=1 Tax=Bombyx mandarina TaxID=7092 RepID=A0A6J2K3G5_BOMMA|nr:serine/arginine repetitive matrix protein 1-like [Bombyx mandarina]
MKVDMAEMRTLVNDLVEKQRSSTPVPPPPEAESEELRRQLLIQEARSSTVERARPPLAHEAKGSPPVPAPRRRVQPAAKTYSGKKKATPARAPAAAAPIPAPGGCRHPRPLQENRRPLLLRPNLRRQGPAGAEIRRGASTPPNRHRLPSPAQCPPPRLT